MSTAITNGQVLALIEAHSVLDKCRLPMETVFLVAENLRALRTVAQSVSEAHDKAFKAMFGEVRIVTPENAKWPEYQDERSRLLNAESGIVGLKPINLKSISEPVPGLASAIEALDSAGLVAR